LPRDSKKSYKNQQSGQPTKLWPGIQVEYLHHSHQAHYWFVAVGNILKQKSVLRKKSLSAI